VNLTAQVADAVRCGLLATPKSLPPFLFYDERGSALFERITELPEYYLTRTERGILETHAEAISDDFSRGTAEPVAAVELGAGAAYKTQILLRVMARRHGRVRYFPSDVSAAALTMAARRVSREEPEVDVTPIVATHDQALAMVRRLGVAPVVLFFGSSIGNYEYGDAAALLRDIRSTFRGGGALLLGTDLRKPTDILLRAYDDASGVTAEFNKNVLARINRDLAGSFELDGFRHVALWNEPESRIEMHLESLHRQRVRIEGLGMDVDFAPRERIHTESSYKYDVAHVDRLLAEAALTRARTFTDERRWFALHVVRPARA
jgi:L-histidine N-alpha-methyltransferase